MTDQEFIEFRELGFARAFFAAKELFNKANTNNEAMRDWQVLTADKTKFPRELFVDMAQNLLNAAQTSWNEKFIVQHLCFMIEAYVHSEANENELQKKIT